MGETNCHAHPKSTIPTQGVDETIRRRHGEELFNVSVKGMNPPLPRRPGWTTVDGDDRTRVTGNLPTR